MEGQSPRKDVKWVLDNVYIYIYTVSIYIYYMCKYTSRSSIRNEDSQKTIFRSSPRPKKVDLKSGPPAGLFNPHGFCRCSVCDLTSGFHVFFHQHGTLRKSSNLLKKFSRSVCGIKICIYRMILMLYIMLLLVYLGCSTQIYHCHRH